MRYYVEILTEIHWESDWFQQFRNVLLPFPIRWQNSRRMPYHLTPAFMDDVADEASICAVVNSHRFPGVVVVDQLEAFCTLSGDEIIIAASAVHPSDELVSSIHDLRDKLTSAGADIRTPFKYHITLGRADATSVSIDELRACIGKAQAPSFEQPPRNIKLIRQRDRRELVHLTI